MNPNFVSLGTMIALMGSLFLALEIGFRSGNRAARMKEAPPTSLIGPVQGALLGLLGLLLGFSFAGSAQRFMDRQDLIVVEANAIGTAYLRADLLDEPHRTGLKKILADYLAYRTEISKTLHTSLSPEIVARVGEMHNEIWRAASAGVAAKPGIMQGVLPPVNDVIDLHTTRIAAGRKHFPVPLLGLLTICAWLSIGMIGYGCGLSKQRVFAMTGSLAFLMGSALWITVDLDHPRNGLIRLSDAPLIELNQSITASK